MDYEPSSPSAPNAIHRLKDRGRYDQETVFSVLDQGTVAHVTFRLPQDSDDADDWPVIIPMIYARDEETVFLHGHLGSRLLYVQFIVWFLTTSEHIDLEKRYPKIM